MLQRKVFISAINLKCFDVSGMEELRAVLNNKKNISLNEIAVGDEKILVGEKIAIDPSSPFYPSKSNEKVMRSEVIASTVCVGELLKEADLPTELLIDIPLYIASGVCFERNQGDMDWFSKALQATISLTTSLEKNKKINQSVPPLLALRTLTNSASSFVAQYSKLSGNNTTFGNTSQGAYFALKEAVRSIRSGETDLAIAGGANGGGLTSYFMFKNFMVDRSAWKESAGAAFVLLESEESLKARNKEPLCEITDLVSSTLIPDLLKRNEEVSFSEFRDLAATADACIFGGAYREDGSKKNEEGAKLNWKNTFSLFPQFGNLGASGLFMNMALAIDHFQRSAYSIVDCVDKDAYARESLVRLKKNQ